MKRADGIVLVDRHICIGCRYCMMACPYKARSFVHQPLTTQNPEVPRGIGCVESCTFCVQRIDKGLKPACVEACPEGAMTFGDLNDPNSAIAQRIAREATTQVRADLKLNLGVRVQGIGSPGASTSAAGWKNTSSTSSPASVPSSPPSDWRPRSSWSTAATSSPA
jgi:molybdopterin-containing oxidoreductase family iron-sulfur binding subunit